MTYIEALISLLLLSVILSAGIRVYFNADEIMVVSTHKKIALEIADAALEEIKRNGYSSLPPGGTILPVQQITVGGIQAEKRLLVFDRDEDPADGTVDYKEVRVEIQWQEAGSDVQRQDRITTLIGP
jgi:type II secretory pathway pseudopilin PulG